MHPKIDIPRKVAKKTGKGRSQSFLMDQNVVQKPSKRHPEIDASRFEKNERKQFPKWMLQMGNFQFFLRGAFSKMMVFP